MVQTVRLDLAGAYNIVLYGAVSDDVFIIWCSAFVFICGRIKRGEKEMANRKNRESNIELLRILAAMAVVIMHYNGRGSLGGFANVAGGSFNEIILTFFEAVTICAVNLFVIISGYFMRSSQKRDLLKPLELFCRYLIFELAAFIIGAAFKSEYRSFDGFLSFFTGYYWFVFIYIALYIISPYLNLVFDTITPKGRKTMLLLSLATFSVYPFIIDILAYRTGRTFAGTSTIGLEGAQSGYTIVTFVLMYLLGCYLRDMDREYKTGNLICFLAADIAAIGTWMYVDKLLTGSFIMDSASINYENPMVIFEAVLVFLIFRNIKMKNVKAINELAGASFSVYLLHIYFLSFFNTAESVKGNPVFLVLHILGSAVIIYILVYIINKVYELITVPVFKAVDHKWKKNRFFDAKDGFQN